MLSELCLRAEGRRMKPQNVIFGAYRCILVSGLTIPGSVYRVLCIHKPTVSRAAALAESIHMVLGESHNQSIC